MGERPDVPGSQVCHGAGRKPSETLRSGRVVTITSQLLDKLVQGDRAQPIPGTAQSLGGR